MRARANHLLSAPAKLFLRQDGNAAGGRQGPTQPQNQLRQASVRRPEGQSRARGGYAQALSQPAQNGRPSKTAVQSRIRPDWQVTRRPTLTGQIDHQNVLK